MDSLIRLDFDIIDIEDGAVLANMQIALCSAGPGHGAPQAGPHAACHHSLQRNLAWNPVAAGDFGDACQHGRWAAGKNNIRFALHQRLLHRAGHKALVAAAAVVCCQVEA